ncbi:K(+)-transporting ATPase subunit F [Terriglobus albidus]|uniref:K(+)-transporting ATPase subunit F n=1 Tax=Terriglobus albidus TaxID=1592106 RepID=A0A5B9E8G4_9BACT|nr:K(+)-transporting ATPase subunit F [Terriglobus albidus]
MLSTAEIFPTKTSSPQTERACWSNNNRRQRSDLSSGGVTNRVSGNWLKEGHRARCHRRHNAHPSFSAQPSVCPWLCTAERKEPMILNCVLLAIVVSLMAYLVYALLRPEKF